MMEKNLNLNCEWVKKILIHILLMNCCYPNVHW